MARQQKRMNYSCESLGRRYRMDRRGVLASVVGGVIASALPARAKPGDKPARVGVLWHARDAQEEAPFQVPFLEGLRTSGMRQTWMCYSSTDTRMSSTTGSGHWQKNSSR